MFELDGQLGEIVLIVTPVSDQGNWLPVPVSIEIETTQKYYDKPFKKTHLVNSQLRVVPLK